VVTPGPLRGRTVYDKILMAEALARHDVCIRPAVESTTSIGKKFYSELRFRDVIEILYRNRVTHVEMVRGYLEKPLM
jgi:predicted GNAT family N-acyltransferase